MLSPIELMNKYFECIFEVELCEIEQADASSDIQKEIANTRLEGAKEALEQITKKVSKRIDVYDYITIKIKEETSSFKARMDELKNEITRIKTRSDSRTNSWKRLENQIKSFIKITGKLNKSGNPFIKTNTATYTIIERAGAIDIKDYNAIPDIYIKEIPREDRVDKAALKKYVKENKPEWADILQTEILVRR